MAFTRSRRISLADSGLAIDKQGDGLVQKRLSKGRSFTYARPTVSLKSRVSAMFTFLSGSMPLRRL